MCLSAWAEGDRPVFPAKRVFPRTPSPPRREKVGQSPVNDYPRPTFLAIARPPKMSRSFLGEPLISLGKQEWFNCGTPEWFCGMPEWMKDGTP
jgi:hypothetical protein